MNRPYLVVHHEITDQAAAQLSELLNDLAFTFDGQYFAQIRRYYDVGLPRSGGQVRAFGTTAGVVESRWKGIYTRDRG